MTGPIQFALPPAPLWAGIGALALFNAYVTWRIRNGRVAGPAEIFGHVMVDVAVLTWLIFWRGGLENPFSSLFVLPIALSILALPGAWVWPTAVGSCAGYFLSALGPQLPHVHSVFGNAFNLHKIGMFANFFVSVLVLLLFFTRMAASWRRSEQEVARLREQFARNEGILALTTHAASVAHELNTSLGTLTLMVEELLREGGTPAQREDYATLKTLIDVCQDRVRELAAPAEAGAAAVLQVNLERVIERWQLVRPTIELHRNGCIKSHEMAKAAVGHLLLPLLNNAADAGQQAGVARVDLELSYSSNGLGIGLALSHATVERLGGKLSMEAAEGRGVQVVF